MKDRKNSEIYNKREFRNLDPIKPTEPVFPVKNDPPNNNENGGDKSKKKKENPQSNPEPFKDPNVGNNFDGYAENEDDITSSPEMSIGEKERICSARKRNADSVKRLFSSISESEVEKYILDDFSFGGWSAPDIKSNEELDKVFDAEIDAGDYVAAYLSAKENGVEISPENEGFFQKCLEKLKPENNWYLKIKDEYIQHAYEEATRGNLGYGKDYWSIKAELKKLKDELNETEKWKENKIIRLEYHIAELEAMLKGYREYNEEPSKVQGDTYVDKYADLYEKGKAPEHYNRWMAGMKSKGYY